MADSQKKSVGTLMVPSLSTVVSLLIVLVLSSGVMALAQQEHVTSPRSQGAFSTDVGRDAAETAVCVSKFVLESPSQDALRSEKQPQAPNDPCLPALYTDWREFADDAPEGRQRGHFSQVRILIDRSSFSLVMEGVRADDSVEEIYRTTVALGDPDSPTPEGELWINHVYAYPDVVFFHASSEPIGGLYNGFFAPLLVCDDRGRCQRHHDLGIHGFHPAASPLTAAMRPDTYGAVSGGCIRLPDPCAFKSALIGSVGVGALRRNDRGTYHWLNKPVRVVIAGYYPGTEPPTLVSIFEEGMHQVQEGLKNLWDGFGQ